MRFFSFLILSVLLNFSLLGITEEELLKRVYDKYGNNKIKNYIIKTEHTYSFPDMPKMTSHQTVYKKGNKVRIETEMDMNGMPMKTLLIGDNKSMCFISGGQIQTMPYDSSKVKEDYFWWQNIKAEDIKIEGEEKVGKHECYIVSFKKNKNNIDKIWIDKENFLLRKEEKTDPTVGKIALILEDYKVHDNLYFPYKMEIYMNTLNVGKVKVISVETNVDIADSFFVVPSSDNRSGSLKEMMDRMMGE